MAKTIEIPKGIEIPTRLGPVVDASVQMPAEDKVRAFVQRSGFLRVPEVASPLTDTEIAALNGDDDAEIRSSYLVDHSEAQARLANSAYVENEETGDWGYWSEFGPRRMGSKLVVPELLPLLEIAEHKIPRLLGCLLGSQYVALGLTEEATPHRDPGFLHYWTLVGTDAETGAQRVELLGREAYETYMGEPYPESDQATPADQAEQGPRGVDLLILYAQIR